MHNESTLQHKSGNASLEELPMRQTEEQQRKQDKEEAEVNQRLQAPGLLREQSTNLQKDEHIKL